MGHCPGDGRKEQAYDRCGQTGPQAPRIFCNPDPAGGTLCKDKEVDFEPKDIRPNGTIPEVGISRNSRVRLLRFVHP